MRCPHCDQEHPENTKFCPIIGQEIIQEYHFCPSCGKQVTIGTNFCPNCASQLPTHTYHTQKPKSRRGLIIGIISAIVIMILVGSTYWFFFKPDVSSNRNLSMVDRFRPSPTSTEIGITLTDTPTTIKTPATNDEPFVEEPIRTDSANLTEPSSTPNANQTASAQTPSETPYLKSTSIISSQPLELFATDLTITPIGNGLKRVVISFGIKNISGSWYKFYLDNNQESVCWWSLGDPPILLTKEGYEYQPEINIHLLCGRRVTPINIPPGLHLSRFPITENGSFTFENFGFIIYEIGENLTPVSVTMNYACGNLLTLDMCEDHFSIEKLVIDLTKVYREGSTFDPDFSEPHYKIGDILNVDSMVTVKIGEPVYSENQLMIPLLITNLNPAYSIDTRGIELALLSKGSMCCWKGPWEGGSNIFSDNIRDILGPSQSKQVFAIFTEFDKFPKEYWENESAVIGLSFNEENKYSDDTVIEFVIDLNN